MNIGFALLSTALPISLSSCASNNTTTQSWLENAVEADLAAKVFTKNSWERGSNENLNGLIRQYIPKDTSINALPEERIIWVENQLNN